MKLKLAKHCYVFTSSEFTGWKQVFSSQSVEMIKNMQGIGAYQVLCADVPVSAACGETCMCLGPHVMVPVWGVRWVPECMTVLSVGYKGDLGNILEGQGT